MESFFYQLWNVNPRLSFQVYRHAILFLETTRIPREILFSRPVLYTIAMSSFYGVNAAVQAGARRAARYWFPPSARHNVGIRRRGRRRRKGFTTKVKRIIANQAETKYIDTVISNNTPVAGTSGGPYALTLVNQGDTTLTRDGDEIYVHSLQIRGMITADDTPVKGSVGRMILYKSNLNLEGNMPIITDILEADNVVGFREHDRIGDFKVLMDYQFVINPTGLQTQTPIELFKYYKRFKSPLKCTYSGTGGGSADLDRGHLYLQLMCDQPTNSQLVWDLKSRVTFKDM